MSNSTEGYADIIRIALRASAGPLSIDDIVKGSIGEVDRKGLSIIIAQRVRAGEVERHHNDSGVLTYSLNPNHGIRIARGGGAKPKGGKVQRSTKPIELAKPVAMAAAVLEPIVSEVAPASLPAARAASLPSFFTEELDSICGDLDAALAEACDARADHALIKDLVIAQAATQRARLAAVKARA